MPVIPAQPWSELVNDMQTGDLILFAGVSSESEWIKLFTGGQFSHSTMIYRPDPSQPPLMWQEAPEAIAPDPHTGTSHTGAQLGDALTATTNIYTDFLDVPYFIKLNWNRPSNLDAMFLALIDKYEGAPFGSVLEMALNYALGHFYNQGTDATATFCAELVALTYQAVGVLDLSHPPNWYSPNSFGPGPGDPIPWLEGASVSLPVEIQLPNADSPRAALAMSSSWPAGALAPAKLAMPPVVHHQLN
ncbi:MAG TPA: hypothetical protein VGG21_04660 [Acidimicrobiales bacterium]